MLGRDRQGYTYIFGNYHPDFYDDVLEVYGQFCKRSGDRDNHILKQAYYDGDDVTIILPVDVGSSGKSTFESMAANLSREGFMVKPDPMPTNKSKLTRFTPFATASENGLVYIVKDTFDKKTLEFIYKQLEQFDGERSTATKHDEFPDLYASGFNYLNKAKVIKPFSLPNISSPTQLANFKNKR